MRVHRAVGLSVLGLWGAWRPAAAQCPDGTPPPCRAAQVASARRDEPLDDRTWLVLPFENTARSTEAEVLRQAGLSLLYQELSRWSDVRVISDDRVNDLLRGLPEAQRAPLGLEAGRTLARRAGAGRVVLGDYVAVGSQAQISAKIYDVRSGRQTHVARERLVGFTGPAALDSMSATYSRLGAAILGLPPRSESGSLAGTSSMEAFQAYLEGMSALNRVDLDRAAANLARAIEADSTFALAQYRLSQITFDRTVKRRYLAAAERFTGSLPLRERTKLALLIAMESSPAEAACEPSARVLALDSNDADGWLGVARCEYRDRPGLIPFPGDPDRRLTAINYHRVAVAARRAVQADPSSVFAHINLFNTLRQTSFGPVCEAQTAAVCPLDSLWVGALVPSGDSVMMPLERLGAVRADPPALRAAAVEYRRSRLTELRRAAEAWLLVAPGNMGARLMLAAATYELGNAYEAARLVDTLPTYLTLGSFVGHELRLQLELALERPGIPRRVDSLYASPESTLVQGQLYSMTGRFGADARRVRAQREAREAWLPVVAGVLPERFDSLTEVVAALQNSPINAAHVREMSTLIAFRMRGTGPALDTAAVHPIRRFQAFLTRGDTARARRELQAYDAALMRRVPGTADDGGWMFAAESYLMLGDSARALALMLEWRRRWNTTPVFFSQRITDQNFFFGLPRLFGRMWLLLADLAAAGNQPAEARRAYRMVINLWEEGDPPVQPAVQRARAALARLGG